MFSEEKPSQARQKANKLLSKNNFTQTHLMVLNIKKCMSKSPIKMFMKKTRAEKDYAY